MKRSIRILFAATALFLAGACTAPSGKTRSGLDPQAFRATIDGHETGLYVLTNRAGVEACITNFGGRLVSLMVPDRNDSLRDVVLGFDNIDDYRNIPSDFGASIGRYANRIGQGRFELDGTVYDLPKNNFGHCLHGGPEGWQYKVYDVEQVTPNSIRMALRSPDGEMHFPGTVTASVTYTLTDDNALEIDFEARTDAPTIINMTNHSYFCLSGNPAKGSMQDVLWIDADSYTPVDSTFMTTGEIASVEGTPMDFRTPTPVGERIETPCVQLANGHGYDHNWVLNTAGDPTKCAARLVSPDSGIILELFTNEPGVQVYTGNFLDGSVCGKRGIAYPRRASICLETQHFPDSPNKSQWPSVVLRPGETYKSHCTYRFSAE